MFDRTIARIRMRLDGSSKGMLINGQERLSWPTAISPR